MKVSFARKYIFDGKGELERDTRGRERKKESVCERERERDGKREKEES